MLKFVSAFRVALSVALLLAGGVCVADEKSDAEESVLTIGSKAPALDIEHWVSDGNGAFKPVTEFEEGKIYVVEFWATWCGPCISSMPHLAELQATHAKDGVQVVSISDEDLDTVNKFLERDYKPRGDTGEEDQPATYGELTSAYCLTADPDKSSENDYMRAAAQNGIPCCFLVGKTGHVEWIGHPMSLDETLEAVIADKWDRSVFAKEFAETQEIDLASNKAIRLVQKKDFDGAIAVFEALQKTATGQNKQMVEFYLSRINEMKLSSLAEDGKIDEAMAILDAQIDDAEESEKKDLVKQKLKFLMQIEEYKKAAVQLEELIEKMSPAELNEVAWSIYTAAAADDGFSKELVKTATMAAEKAVEADPENAPVLDTLAHLVYLNGDLKRAIEIQTKAVKHQDPPSDEISDFLKKLQKEAKESEDK